MSVVEFSPSTSPSTLTRSQRWARFVDEELVSFAMASTAYAGVVLAKEYRSAGPHAPRRLHLALHNTRALLPAIALSAAVGIAGMKLSIAAVSHAREDYTHSSVLLAFPVAGALLQMQRGPRAMAMSAMGFAVIGFGADHLFAQWHRRNAEAQGEVAIQHDHHHQQQQLYHHHEAFHLESFRPTASFMLESPQK